MTHTLIARHTTRFAAAAVLLTASAAGAADPGPLRLADVLADARRDNPQIAAAHQRATAVAAVPARVSAYDDPTFSYEAWNVPDSNPFRVDRADNNILRLSQKIPFPGKRTLAGVAAGHDAEVAQHDVEAIELDVATAVKRAFATLWEVHETLAVYAREQALVDRLAHVAEEKYAVGVVPQADVVKAQVELTHIVNQRSTQQLRIQTAAAALNVLLSRPPDATLAAPEPLPPARLDDDLASLTALALRSRPELAGQNSAIAREQTGLALARKSYLPDFEVSVGRFINPGRDGYGAMAAVTLPFVYRSKYQAGVSEASARDAQAHAELRGMEDRIRGEVADAFLRARTALLQRDLFLTTHIPHAEQSLQVTESGYRAGTVDFLSLIDTARTIESIHVEHIEAEAEFERAHADLERAVGAELPRAPLPSRAHAHQRSTP